MREQFIEGRRQLPGQGGIFNPDAHVAPAARHAVAIVFIGHIESADEDRGVVANQQLAVIAHAEPPEMEGIEAAHFRAGGNERRKKIIRQQPRTERIHQDLDAHAAPRRRQQGFQKLPPQLSVGINVSFQPDGFPRRRDGLQHGRKDFLSRAEPLPGKRFWSSHDSP